MSMFHRNVMLIFLLVSILFGTSCAEEEEVDPIGNWVEKSDFEGLPRSDAVHFVIGSRAYVATGFDGYDRLNDLWEYDPERDYWVQKADFPGVPRNAAVGFSLNGKGYLGTGYDGENRLTDFWEYDPENDTWTQKADFGGSERYGAIGFALEGLGYIGTGTDGNDLKDLWEYDPVQDSWEQGVSVGGSKRVDAFVFVVNGKAYVGGGRNNGVYEEDFWEYDPVSRFWTERVELINDDDEDDIDDYNITRSDAVAFEMNGKGYLGMGLNGGNRIDMWEYNPQLDTWEEKTNFEGAPRRGASVLAFGNETFILAGTSGGTTAFDDVWKFDPEAENDEDD